MKNQSIRNLKQTKFKRITVRFTEVEIAAIYKNALVAGLPPSTLIRRQALSHPIPSKTDQQTVIELRRLGAMLKHLYPKESNWSQAEKQRYWAALNTLIGCARHLTGD